MADYKDEKLEMVLNKIYDRLLRTTKRDGVHISDSHRPGTGVDIENDSEEDVRNLINEISTHKGKTAYLHGMGPLRDSYQEAYGSSRPLVNAGLIELAKYLPYTSLTDKNKLYRMIGMQIGDDVTIAPRVQLDYLSPELIRIGDNVIIGDGAKLWTHNFSPTFYEVGPIIIGDNTLISSDVTVGPGTIIGNNVEVGYGAVLHHMKVPDGAKVAGRDKAQIIYR